MKKFQRLILFFTVLSIIMLTACGNPATDSTQQTANADLVVLGSSNSKLFLGPDYRSEGVLKLFFEETGYKIHVQYGVGGPVADVIKNSSISVPVDQKTSETHDAFIFDDQLFAEGLKDKAYIASVNVGIWIRQDKANSLGLYASNPYITHNTYAALLSDKKLSMINANASRSTASALDFFATLANCSGNPSAALTVNTAESSQACGKQIYDHYVRSEGSTGDAVKKVFEDNLNGNNLFDGVVAFQSSFAGPKGLNQQLVDAGKQPFIFFYYSDASPVANMVIGNSGNLTETEKKVYDAFVEFIASSNAQVAQNFVAQYAMNPGSSAFGVNVNQDAFRAEWGLLLNPQITPVNAPVYSVAQEVLDLFNLYYKRAKYIKGCLDVSGSMFQDPKMSIVVNGQEISVYRMQALNRAILMNLTNEQWLAENKLTPNLKDIFEYSFFSVETSSIITSTTGDTTEVAGEKINSIVGPWDENNPTAYWDPNVAAKNVQEISGVDVNGTEMFKCANTMLEQIKDSYNPEIDYYIVILSDGENDNYSVTGEQFYQNWYNYSGKTNITLIGIAFGTDGKSINKEYTKRFGGDTFTGDDDKGLIDAFRSIYSR